MKAVVKATLLVTGLIILLSACAKTDNPQPSPTDARAKFLGDWNVNEQKKKLNYQVSITADPNYSDRVRMANFAATNATAIASVSGNTITLLPSQSLATITIVSGTGTYASTGSSFILSYSYIGSDQVSVVATFTK